MQTEATPNQATLEPKGISYQHESWQSIQSVGFKFFSRVLGIKSDKDFKERVNTGNPSKRDEPEPPKRFFKNFNVTVSKIKDRNVFRIEPKENKTSKVIIHFHGGGYVFNFVSYHWDFFEKVINSTNCTIIAPDYPLAPQFSYLENFEFVDALYNECISTVDSKNLALMGDSAGGALALATAQRIKQQGLPQPAHTILISPWLDMTLSNPEIAYLDKKDPMVSVEGCKIAAEAYSKGADLTQYLLSPINGELEGIGRVSVFIGTHDVVYADAKKLKSLADQKNVPINFFVYPKMMHIWMIFGMCESNKAIEQIRQLIL